MNEDEIKNLRIGNAVSVEIETLIESPPEAGGYPEVESKDHNAQENSFAPGENLDIILQADRINREYPAINEHPGYWGIFVRKGS